MPGGSAVVEAARVLHREGRHVGGDLRAGGGCHQHGQGRQGRVVVVAGSRGRGATARDDKHHRHQPRDQGARRGRSRAVGGQRKSACYSTLREMVNPPSPPGRAPAGIQQALRDERRSALTKYQDLVVGSRSLFRLIGYELAVTFTSWVPGALGLVLRRLFYPPLLGRCGRNVTFGQGVVLRHPAKIRLGDDVVVDDLVVLDAKGESNQGITVGASVF